MSSTRKIPEDIYETPPPEPTPDRPSGSWPRSVQTSLDTLKADVLIIKDALVGTINKDGIAARVRKLEDDNRSTKKYTAAMVLAFIGAAGTTVWNVVLAVLSAGKANH